MVKDSISYINALSDTIAIRDSVQHDPFSIQFGNEESVDMRAKGDRLTTYIGEDEPRHDGTPLPFLIEQVDGIFVLLLLCFLFFTHIYNGGLSFLKENVSLLFSSDKAQRIHRQTTAKELIYSYFLLFQTVVLVSVCIYAILVEYNPQPEDLKRPLSIILSFIIVISVFYVMKDLLFRAIGYIFDASRSMAIWRRIHIVAIEILGILYFIPTLLLVYADFYHFEIAVFILVLFLIVQIILFHQIIIFFISEKLNFLYLIAYLCTFEILPYIFLIVGLVYLYRIDVFNILWP